jgi:trans-aconitate methyltransferase
MSDRFDAAYYSRFYGRRPVHNRKQIAHLAEGVMSFAKWWRIPIRSVLDVGAGKGYWRDCLANSHPTAKYHGIDASEFASRRFHHEHVDIATWQPPRRYDLVVCQSVLQYLDDASATRAIRTLATACRGLLYFETPTVSDRTTVIDRSSTDLDVHWRSGSWYRKQLAAGFTEIGAGLWLSRECATAFFELETAR